MDLFHFWLTQKPKTIRHASFSYSIIPETNIWMCTLVVHDDGYVYVHTANTMLFQHTQKNTKQTAKKLAVCAVLRELDEEVNALLSNRRLPVTENLELTKNDLINIENEIIDQPFLLDDEPLTQEWNIDDNVGFFKNDSVEPQTIADSQLDQSHTSGLLDSFTFGTHSDELNFLQ